MPASSPPAAPPKTPPAPPAAEGVQESTALLTTQQKTDLGDKVREREGVRDHIEEIEASGTNDSPELDAHGKEAVNFQISMLIYNAIAAVFCLVLIGFVFLAVLWILNAVLCIIVAIKASYGEFYRYPMTIRFIQ